MCFKGIYDTQIKVSNVPMLNWIVPKEFIGFKASTIMSTPVVCIQMIENAGTIIDILKTYTYNGFPVIDEAYDVIMTIIIFKNNYSLLTKTI